jgi:hypothetical protein
LLCIVFLIDADLVHEDGTKSRAQRRTHGLVIQLQESLLERFGNVEDPRTGGGFDYDMLGAASVTPCIRESIELGWVV